MSSTGVALGTTKIAKMKNLNDQIPSIVDGELSRYYNTYQWITKNISNWADETAVGKDLRDALGKLVACFSELMICTKEFHTEISNFLTEQEQINNSQA